MKHRLSWSAKRTVVADAARISSRGNGWRTNAFGLSQLENCGWRTLQAQNWIGHLRSATTSASLGHLLQDASVQRTARTAKPDTRQLRNELKCVFRVADRGIIWSAICEEAVARDKKEGSADTWKSLDADFGHSGFPSKASSMTQQLLRLSSSLCGHQALPSSERSRSSSSLLKPMVKAACRIDHKILNEVSEPRDGS